MTHQTYKTRQMEILHEFGTTYNVLLKEERLKDIDEASKALDALLLEVAEASEDNENWCSCLSSIRSIVEG